MRYLLIIFVLFSASFLYAYECSWDKKFRNYVFTYCEGEGDNCDVFKEIDSYDFVCAFLNVYKDIELVTKIFYGDEEKWKDYLENRFHTGIYIGYWENVDGELVEKNSFYCHPYVLNGRPVCSGFEYMVNGDYRKIESIKKGEDKILDWLIENVSDFRILDNRGPGISSQKEYKRYKKKLQ